MSNDSPVITETDIAVQLRREYQRKWRKEHPEKSKEYADRYWRKRARQIMEGVNNGR